MKQPGQMLLISVQMRLPKTFKKLIEVMAYFHCMFFALSKIFYFLLVPYHWIIGLLLLMWLVKKPAIRKRLGMAALAIALLFSNPFLSGIAAWYWQPPVHPQVHTRNYPVGILLCGITIADAQERRYFGGTSDRFIQAVKLYQTGQAKKILISGGDGSLKQNSSGEATFLYREMRAMQIPDSQLLVEPFSKNTYESAVAAKQLLDSIGIRDSVLLITSGIHMRRAMASFTKAGIPVVPHVANYMTMRRPGGLYNVLVPDLSLLSSWQFLLKEMVGYAVYKMTGKG